MAEQANAELDYRSMVQADSRSRRRCCCGCKTRATHVGLAGGIAMMKGCEFFTRVWVRDGSLAFATNKRTEQSNDS